MSLLLIKMQSHSEPGVKRTVRAQLYSALQFYLLHINSWLIPCVLRWTFSGPRGRLPHQSTGRYSLLIAQGVNLIISLLSISPSADLFA